MVSENSSDRLVAVELVVILVLTLAGMGMGAVGTASPDVDPPSGLWSDVSIVAPASPDAPGPSDARVSFQWTMDSEGHVTITAYADDGTELEEPREFTILLACGARLDDIVVVLKSSPDGPSLEHPQEFGDESVCGATSYEPEKIPRYQAITIKGRAILEGNPMGNWTDARGGQRLARTPSIGWFSPRLGDVSVAPSSNAATDLTGKLDESLDSITPAEVSSGDVVFDSGEGMLVGDVREDAAVRWTTTRCGRAETEQEWKDCAESERVHRPVNRPDLRSGIARWTQLGGQEHAQWFTLGSGLLLGIAATLVIEWLRRELRRRLRATRSPSQAKWYAPGSV